MTTVVLDSKDLVQSVMTGTVPVPAGIAEDNAAQAAKKDAVKTEDEPTHTTVDNAPEKEPAKVEAAAETEVDVDDVEGDDGLTPRQKREFTKSMLATIAKKHRAQREAEEFATTQYNQNKLAEQRAQQLAQENAQLKERLKPQEVKVEEVKAPKREDFETDEAYEDARVDYRVDQKLKTQASEAEVRRQEQHKQEVVQHAVARIERAIELVPDFKEVTESQDVPVPEFIASYMQESDMFAELGYHFAKHPDVLQKLTEFTANTRPGTLEYSKAVTRQLVEVGKIESTLSPFASPASKNGAEPSQKNGAEPSHETGSAPSKPRVQAPIIRPLNAGSAASVQKDEGDMKTSEVIRTYQKRHGVQLTARKRH